MKDVEIATPKPRRPPTRSAEKAYSERAPEADQRPDRRDRQSRIEEQTRCERAKRAARRPALLAALNTPKDKRTPEQKTLAKDAQEQIKPAWDDSGTRLIPPEVASGARGCAERCTASSSTSRIRCPPLARRHDVHKAPPTTYVLKVGDSHNRLDPVEPGLPESARPRGRAGTGFRRRARDGARRWRTGWRRPTIR